MTVRITLPDLPAWTALTDQQRWHAGYLARKLDDSRRVAKWRPGCVSQVRFNLPNEIAVEERLQLWAMDSLLCALTHAEPKIALRALLQAQEYLTKLAALEQPVGALRDSYVVAQTRIEDVLPEAVRRAS